MEPNRAAERLPDQPDKHSVATEHLTQPQRGIASDRRGNAALEALQVAEQTSLSGLTVEQAKEFHEQFKVTYTAFAGIAAVAHFLVIAWKPWF